MRNIMRIVLAVIIVVMASSLPAQADRGRHGHGRGGGRVGVGVYLGPGWVSPGWWGPYPYYPYYPPPIFVERPSDIYVQPAPSPEEPRYWYYCKDPEGYYPDVKSCPKGWMKVVRPAQPPAGEE